MKMKVKMEVKMEVKVCAGVRLCLCGVPALHLHRLELLGSDHLGTRRSGATNIEKGDPL